MPSVSFVDHPIALLLAVLVSAPMVWKLARAWFPDPMEDAKEAAPYFLIDALGGPMFANWPFAKLIWFLIVSATIVVTCYKVAAWIVG
jgi:hypothetical protein